MPVRSVSLSRTINTPLAAEEPSKPTGGSGLVERLLRFENLSDSTRTHPDTDHGKGAAKTAARAAVSGSEVLENDEDGLISDVIRTVYLRDAIAQLKVGATMWKLGKFMMIKRRSAVFVKVNMENLRLAWCPQQKQGNPKAWREVAFMDVKAVLPAVNSKQWKGSDSERRLGIEVVFLKGRHFHSRLRFVAESNTQWRIWLRGLIYAERKAAQKRKSLCVSHGALLLRKQWDMADTDKSGSIQLPECTELLKKMGYVGDPNYVEALFNSFIDDESQVLEFEQFEQFMVALLCPMKLMTVFSDYCPSGTPVLDDRAFALFLRNSQLATPAEIETCLQEVREYEEPFRVERNDTENNFKQPALQQGEGITIFGFCRFLLSSSNICLDPQKTSHVHHNMQRPINCYYIKSCGKLAIINDRLAEVTAATLVERIQNQYLVALASNNRCIYVECKPGRKGPVIQVGREGSMDHEVLLEEILFVIATNAFVSNKYPVILVIEMLGLVTQTFYDQVAREVARFLGPQLYHGSSSRSATISTFPTPQDLLGKFIVLEAPSAEEGVRLLNSEWSCDWRLEQRILQSSWRCLYGSLKRDDSQQRVPHEVGENLSNECTALSNQIRPSDVFTSWSVERVTGIDSTTELAELSTRELKFLVVTEKLLRCIATYKSGGAEATHLDSKLPVLFERLLSSTLMLVQPTGNDLAYSSPNLPRCWKSGAQMVTIPFLSMGKAAALNYALFLENGGIGYVLKSAPTTGTQLGNLCVSLSILGGRQIPRSQVDALRPGGFVEPVDWQVRVNLFIGHCMDGKPPSSVFLTQAVRNSGLNPTWPTQSMSFTVDAQTTAFLVFEVMKLDRGLSSIAAAVAATTVSTLRQGIRWLPLFDNSLCRRPGSGLLLDIRFHSSLATAAMKNLDELNNMTTLNPGRLKSFRRRSSGRFSGLKLQTPQSAWASA